MKIFISHSSKDKWAARRISDDLINFGTATFLDEKDIQTGESIDKSIKLNLKECDDFLIVISPASIKSDWVLLELGGAIALDKKIIPILMYVGVNEIPQAINLKLARDINDIGIYYQEIIDKIKANGKPMTKKSISKKTPSPKGSTKVKFKVGQRVRIVSRKPMNVYKGGMLVDWEDPMNDFLGSETTIRRNWGDGSYGLAIDKDSSVGPYVWAEEWLIPIT